MCLESFKVASSDEDSEALEAPLLRSGFDELGNRHSSLHRMEITAPVGPDSMMYSPGPSANSGVRRLLYVLLQYRTAADALPSILQVIVTSGKMSVLFFGGFYFVFISLWFPFWLLSFLVSELGVYTLLIGTIFLVGRSIIRLIAFPGSSQRVSSEIENEFSKYSVRMLISASNSIIDFAEAVSSKNSSGEEPTFTNQTLEYFEISSLWKRSKSYRDRVLGVYAETLHFILNDCQDTLGNSPSDLTKYGNNKLSGDIGDLSGLTVRISDILFMHVGFIAIHLTIDKLFGKV